MQTFFKKVFFLMALTLTGAIAQAGENREIGDGTLPLGILPMQGDIALHVREEAQSVVGFLTHDGKSLPLREVMTHNNGEVTMLFGDVAEGVELTGTLAAERFTGHIFFSAHPGVAIPVAIAR